MSKKKITDPEGSMEELIARAVEAAKAPFTTDRKAELPSLRSVAEELGTTVIRTRKLLITAGYFTSPTASTVQRLKAEGKTMVFVTHNLSSARELCDRAVWLNNGVIAKDGDTNEVIDEYVKATT